MPEIFVKTLKICQKLSPFASCVAFLCRFAKGIGDSSRSRFGTARDANVPIREWLACRLYSPCAVIPAVIQGGRSVSSLGCIGNRVLHGVRCFRNDTYARCAVQNESVSRPFAVCQKLSSIGVQGQRLRQMLTEFPPSYHSGEDIHEHCDIDEVSLRTAQQDDDGKLPASVQPRCARGKADHANRILRTTHTTLLLVL